MVQLAKGDFMLNVFTVSFFGHRIIDNPMLAEEKIENLVRECIRKKDYVEFLVGRDGDFDIIVASCIRRIKKELFNANSSLVWVLPYPKSEYLKNQREYENYYNEIEVFESQKRVHPKAAFKLRNKEMLNRSYLAVFWVKKSYGGAYETLRYAKKNNTKYINISQIEEIY